MTINLKICLAHASALALALHGAGWNAAFAQDATNGAAVTDGDARYDYGPLDPVPAAQMRAFTIDGPGKVLLPQTVDAGHLQVEARLFDYSLTKAHGTTIVQWTAPKLLLRYGLSDWADLEITLPGAQNLHEDDRGAHVYRKARGIGDSWVGARFNLFGNDPGDGPAGQGFAIIPMLKIPTAKNGLGSPKIEASVALPYQISFPADWKLLVESQNGLRANHSGRGYAGDFGALVNVSHSLLLRGLSAQVEYSYDISTDTRTGHAMTIDPGLEWTIKPGLAVDAGDYVGLSSNAAKLSPHVGISARF